MTVRTNDDFKKQAQTSIFQSSKSLPIFDSKIAEVGVSAFGSLRRKLW